MALTLGVALLVTGCPERKEAPPALRSRNAAVSGKTPTITSAPPPPTTSAAPEPKEPRVFCKGRLDKPRDLPEPDLERKAMPGARRLPDQLATSGKWTWVNFWAAWCAPCKEEIPRLVAWEKKLNDAGVPFRLAFVSLDDDERQLMGFLEAQPEDGLRATHWLKDADEREEWLDDIGVGATAELPAHLILDQQGKLRCIVKGAVEDGDYEQVARLLGANP